MLKEKKKTSFIVSECLYVNVVKGRKNYHPTFLLNMNI